RCCVQADCGLGRAAHYLLEGRRGFRDSGRTSRYDTFWFASGCLASRPRGNISAARAACGGGLERPGTVAMSTFEQRELGFPGARPNHKLRRGIYLLPSFMTVASLLCGFYAVMSTLKGNVTDLDNAAKAIGLAIVFDSFDGFVARATGTTSEFG